MDAQQAAIHQVEAGDIPALQGMVSEDFGDWSPPLAITQGMVDEFAKLTGDRQWIHIDVERARRESPFGSTIVHGFLLLALLPSLRPTPRFTVTAYTTAVNYGSAGLRFLAPVPVGAEVHSRQRLKRAESHKRGVLLTSEVVIAVVGGDRPALVYDLQVLYVIPAAT